MLTHNEQESILNTVDKDASWRNVNLTIFAYVKSKYEDSELINAYGDIFSKVKYLNGGISDHTYICRRVLWSLCLSKEYYKVREFAELDSDGEFDYWEYEITPLSEEEVKKYEL